MRTRTVAIFLSTFFVAFSTHAQTSLTLIEKAKISQSIENCQTKSDLLTKAKWAGIAFSAAGAPIAIAAAFTGYHSPTGQLAKGTELSSNTAAGLAVVGAIGAGYIITFSTDYNELGRLAGEIGYNQDGVIAIAFQNRCLRDNPEHVCTRTLEELRTQARDGKMCEWNILPQ